MYQHVVSLLRCILYILHTISICMYLCESVCSVWHCMHPSHVCCICVFLYVVYLCMYLHVLCVCYFGNVPSLLCLELFNEARFPNNSLYRTMGIPLHLEIEA